MHVLCKSSTFFFSQLLTINPIGAIGSVSEHKACYIVTILHVSNWLAWKH